MVVLLLAAHVNCNKKYWSGHSGTGQIACASPFLGGGALFLGDLTKPIIGELCHV